MLEKLHLSMDFSKFVSTLLSVIIVKTRKMFGTKLVKRILSRLLLLTAIPASLGMSRCALNFGLMPLVWNSFRAVSLDNHELGTSYGLNHVFKFLVMQIIIYCSQLKLLTVLKTSAESFTIQKIIIKRTISSCI